MSAFISRIDCGTVDDLLDKLSPRNAFWRPSPEDWIYRGQADDWPLKAKVLREGDQFAPFGIPHVGGGAPIWASDGHRLQFLLTSFSEALDRAGLPLPSPTPDLFDMMAHWPTDKPKDSTLPLLALAQHYGLPTPWLDWSSLARTAAYFACGELVDKEMPPGRLVIWALSRAFAEACSLAPEIEGTRLQLVTTPRGSNPRLHAQAGVFTWLRGEMPNFSTVDGYVEKLAGTDPDMMKGRRVPFTLPLMHCFTLDRAQAPKLLEVLAYEGVSAATIFPGYEGVVQGMKERTFWEAHRRGFRRR
jgi:hypothetical protein